MPDRNDHYLRRRPPPSPPPAITPQYCKMEKDLTDAFIRQHMNLFIYVWTEMGPAFWMYPMSLDGDILSGYIWKDAEWRYARLHMSQIRGFF